MRTPIAKGLAAAIIGIAAAAAFMLFALTQDSAAGRMLALAFVVLLLMFLVRRLQTILRYIRAARAGLAVLMFLVRWLQTTLAPGKREAMHKATVEKAMGDTATASANALLDLQMKQQQIETKKAKAKAEQQKGCFWGCLLVGLVLFVLGFLAFCGMFATEDSKQIEQIEQIERRL